MYNQKIVEKVIKEYVINQKSVAELSLEFNISKSTIYLWLRVHKIDKDLPKKYLPIKELLKEKKYELIIKELNDISGYNEKFFLFPKLFSLIKIENYEEALNFSEQELCLNDPQLQSLRIKALLKLNRLQEALEICKKEEFQNDFYIMLNKITILEKLDRLEDALEVCENELFKNTHPFVKARQRITNKLQRVKNNPFFIPLKSNITDLDLVLTEVQRVFTLIYANKIQYQELMATNIPKWEKTILAIYYFEKNNKKEGMKYIRNYITTEKNNLTESEIKILKNCFENLKRSKKIQDIEFYVKILGTGINIAFYETLQQKKEVNTTQLKTIDELKKIDGVAKPNPPKFTGNKTSTFSTPVNANYQLNFSKIPNEKKKEKREKQKSKKELTIKDLFSTFVLKIESYIYSQLNSQDEERKAQALIALERFYRIYSQPITNKEAIDKMKKIINVFEHQNQSLVLKK